MSSEKEAPSAVAMLGEIRSAIFIEKRQAKNRSTLKDLLGKVVSAYNKEVTVRRHRLDTARKGLLYNLCLVCHMRMKVDGLQG